MVINSSDEKLIFDIFGMNTIAKDTARAVTKKYWIEKIKTIQFCIALNHIIQSAHVPLMNIPKKVYYEMISNILNTTQVNANILEEFLSNVYSDKLDLSIPELELHREISIASDITSHPEIAPNGLFVTWEIPVDDMSQYRNEVNKVTKFLICDGIDQDIIICELPFGYYQPHEYRVQHLLHDAYHPHIPTLGNAVRHAVLLLIGQAMLSDEVEKYLTLVGIDRCKGPNQVINKHLEAIVKCSSNDKHKIIGYTILSMSKQLRLIMINTNELMSTILG